MKKIVLASQSPRRKELLSRFIDDYRTCPSSLDERIARGESPSAVSMALAFEKARKVADQVGEDSIIISADTLVSLDSRILSKPRNREEARQMLLDLSSKSHRVLTGICLLAEGKKIVDYEETIVKFREIDQEMLENYLDSGEYKDKAGAYGIQGLGSVLVERIEGCYFNVVGLPIYKLDILLREHFDRGLL